MSDLYEIVELPDGEIALRRAGEEEDGDPLVTISFSEEALYFLNQSKFAVAKAMIEAGLDAATEEGADEASEEHLENSVPTVFH
ncbi:hypothetical protein [Agaribacterium sp. ZY112]|uniref:hypothetical protein n=1 Tax=Agaribacterium sp. ZY112 TaxID=3233574 RepID=UPI00352390EE